MSIWFWLSLVAIAIVLWAWLRPGSKEPVVDTETITASVVVKQAVGVPVRCEPVQGGWRVGSNLPLPMTLLGVAEADAQRLASAAQERNYDLFSDWLVDLIAKKNVRCLEVDQWVASARPKFEASVKQAIAASEAWGSASERDREDLLRGFRERAVEELQVRPDPQMALTLLLDEPKDSSVDDALLHKFADRPELYQVLLRMLASGDEIRIEPVGGYRRKELEELAARGYVLWGESIPLDDVLNRLTLKQMAEISGDVAPKKFTRKAAATEFLKALPDVKARVGKVLAYRELFKVAPLEGVDAAALVESYRYSGEMARLIRRTLFAGVATLQEREYAKESGAQSWSLDASDCCPECKKLDGKTWKQLPQRLPPFHVGCDCSISADH